MRKVLVLSVILLAFGALVATPGVAVDVDAKAQIDLVEEEALMTPVETPELPELVPGDSTRENKIRECTETEAQKCAPNCCVVVGGAVTCVC